MDLFTVVARLGMDSSEYESGLKKAQKASQNIVKTVENVAQKTEQVTEAAIAVVEKLAEETEQVAEVTKKSYRQLQSDAGKLAWTYQQAGMSQSEAMKKANAELRATGQYETFIRKNADAMEEVAKASEEAKASVEEFGQKAKKAVDSPKSSWLSFGGIIKKTGERFDWAAAKAVVMGNLISRAMEKAVNVAVDLGKSAVQNAADVTAEKAQFQATFGLMQGEAEKAFAAIEKETGIFGTRLQKVGTKAFSQFAGAGIKGADGLAAMEEYTKLAADAAAYYDISLEDADERLRSFLRGNTEAGDAVGLFTSESQRNSAAMEKYGQKWQALTEAQKQMLMLDISKDIYEQSGAIGQAARESDAWTNVIGNLKEAWRQATGTLGKPIMAVLTPVLQNVGDWLNDPQTQIKIDQFGLGVADAINWILDPKFPTWEEVKAGAQTTLDEINNGLEAAVNWTLGKLGMPDAETVVSDVKNWWTGQGDNAYERVKSVLTWSFGKWVAPTLDVIDKWWNGEGGGEDALLGLLGWTLGEFVAPAIMDVITSTGQTIAGWATGFIKGVIDLLDWTLGEFNLPTASDIINRIQDWWSGIRESLNLTFGATFKINPSVNENREANIQSATDYLGPYANGWGNDYSFEPTGSAGGLYYARNNYITRLHEGEAVLNSRQAMAWRADQSGSSADLIAEIRALRQELLTRRPVMTPDGRVLGEISYEAVSQNIAADSHSRRYSFG